MPRDAEILCVQMQQEDVCLWAEVVPERAKVKRRFEIFGTGHPIDPNIDKKYLGTVQLLAGGLVLHVFENLG